MKERPILFSTDMVRAIIDGRKTQTRRVVKRVGNDEGFVLQDYGSGWWPYRSIDGESGLYQGKDGYDLESPINCPYGLPGDRLWVRETWAPHPDYSNHAVYRADYGVEFDCERWRPSIHMPRWASRILLEIVRVRVERLQDISEADAIAEGCPIESPDPFVPGHGSASASGWYSDLWEKINGAGSWAANPWVWVVEFRGVE